MKFITEFPKSKENMILVLTGDGREEERILRGFAQKFDGKNKLLVWPKLPIAKKTGLEGLEAISTYSRFLKYEVKVLFLVDREHIDEKSEKNLVKEIQKLKLIKNSKIKEFKNISKGAIYLEISLGPRDFTIYTVILGIKKCATENMAQLLEIDINNFSDINSCF